MNCLVCDGRGWLKAAPVSGRDGTKPAALWLLAVAVPCFACGLRNLAVAA